MFLNEWAFTRATLGATRDEFTGSVRFGDRVFEPKLLGMSLVT